MYVCLDHEDMGLHGKCVWFWIKEVREQIHALSLFDLCFCCNFKTKEFNFTFVVAVCHILQNINPFEKLRSPDYGFKLGTLDKTLHGQCNIYSTFSILYLSIQ